MSSDASAWGYLTLEGRWQHGRRQLRLMLWKLHHCRVCDVGASRCEVGTVITQEGEHRASGRPGILGIVGGARWLVGSWWLVVLGWGVGETVEVVAEAADRPWLMARSLRLVIPSKIGCFGIINFALFLF